MDKLYRNLIYDLKAGLGRNKIYYFVWSILIFFLTITITAELKQSHQNYTFASFDIINRFFLGVRQNSIFDKTETMQIPFEWLIPHIYILIGAARYPIQDFDECGYNLWIRTRSKMAWWVSKTAWCSVHVVTTHLIWLFIIVIATFCMNGDTSFKFTNIYHMDVKSAEDATVYIAALIMPLIVNYAIGIMTMAVSFIVTPIIGFFTGCLALLAAVFFNNDFLAGKYMMLYSYFPVNETTGVSIAYGITLCMMVILCSFFAGYIAYYNNEN